MCKLSLYNYITIIFFTCHSAATVQFDGTKQCVSVNLDPNLGPDQQQSSWEVLVVRRRLFFGTRLEQFEVEVVAPPIPCVGTCSSTVCDALYSHATSVPWNKVAERAAHMSNFTCRVRSADGAGSCLKYFAHEANALVSQDQAHVSLPCIIHITHIVVGLIIAQIGLEYLSVLYSMALLLRSGGYFLRLILAVRMLVRDHSLQLAVPATPRDIELARAFLQLCEPSPHDEAQRLRIEGSRERFLAVFNGGYSRWLSQSRLSHYCAGPECCPGDGPERWLHTQDRMVQAIMDYLLALRPGVPALARWTLIAPAVCFFLRLAVVHKLLAQLLTAAFAGLENKLYESMDNAAATMKSSEHMEAAIVDEFHWHAASGKRLKSAKAFLSIDSNREGFFLMALILQLLSFMTSTMLKTRGPEDSPLLHDLTNPEFSCIIVALQFLSSLLMMGTAMHIELFWRLCGHASVNALYADTVRLIRLRSLIVTTSAWLYGRHWHLVTSMPCAVVGMSDLRRCRQDRLSIAERVNRLTKCCGGRLVSVMRSTVRTARELLGIGGGVVGSGVGGAGIT